MPELLELLRRMRRAPRAVMFEDEQGSPMSLRQVRAGMLIVQTDYRHGSAELTVRLERRYA